MSFNRENLTSVSILLDYFAIEVRNRNLLYLTDEMAIVKDIMFRFEYARLKNLYKKYNTESMILVLKTESELQSIQVYEKIEKMLRSLDMVTKIKEKRNYFILIMFPLHDKAAAEGFHKRLISTMKEDRDKNMESATFSMSQTGLINKYLREDYGE